MKSLFLISVSVLLIACNSVSSAPQNTPLTPQTISFGSCNQAATEHLQAALSRTSKAACIVNNQTYDLTREETEKLLVLLTGVQSDTPLCAPEDCFYINLQEADGTWLMSLPVQNTPEGIVLLYLKLQGNNAGAPLQGWWRSLSSRLGI